MKMLIQCAIAVVLVLSVSCTYDCTAVLKAKYDRDPAKSAAREKNFVLGPVSFDKLKDTKVSGSIRLVRGVVEDQNLMATELAIATNGRYQSALVRAADGTEKPSLVWGKIRFLDANGKEIDWTAPWDPLTSDEKLTVHCGQPKWELGRRMIRFKSSTLRDVEEVEVKVGVILKKCP